MSIYDEKEKFTAGRKRNYKLSYATLAEAEHQWGNYCFIPLDIPKLSEAKQISKWFFENSKQVIKLKADIACPLTGKGAFNSVDVLVNACEKKERIWSINNNHDFLNEFPKFHEELLDLFPYVEIPHFKFWQSIREVYKHRDDQDFRDFPSSFRALIYDENPEETLFIEECLPNTPMDQTGKTVKVPRLSDSHSFAWNNLRTKHFSSHDEKYRKIILILNGTHIDYKKYRSLMERSVEKYSEYCMLSDYQIHDFIEDPYSFQNLPSSEIKKILSKIKE